MPLPDTVGRIRQRVTVVVSRRRTNDDSERTEDRSESRDPSVEYDPQELERHRDTMCTADMTPEEVVRALLETAGRSLLPQQAFTECTEWSEAAVSRVLCNLEADGRVVRMQIGRQTVVCLPDAVPLESRTAPDHRGQPSRG